MQLIKFSKKANLFSNQENLWADIFCFLIILVSGILFTIDISQFIDVLLYDEISYLIRGVNLPVLGIPTPDWAPLYSLYYFIISFIQPNFLDLYYFSYRLSIILPALIFYASLRVIHVSRVLSLVTSIVLHINIFSLLIWPKVSHFAVIIMFAGFYFASKAKDPMRQIIWLACTVLLMSYARPEFFVSFLFALTYLAILCFSRLKKQFRRMPLKPMTAAGSIALICIAVFGIPLGGGDRAMVAFGQHYAVNWVRAYDHSIDPWNNYTMIISNDFPGATSTMEALLTNPSAFLWHIGQNIQYLFYKVEKHLKLVMPENDTSLWLSILSIVAVSFLIIIYSIKRYPFLMHNLKQNFKSDYRLLPVYFFIVFPSLVSIFLIGARSHYIYLLIMVTAYFTVRLLSDRNPNAYSAKYTYPIGSILLISIVLIKTLFPNQTVERPNYFTARAIESLDTSQPLTILEAEGGFHHFAPKNSKRISETEKTSNIDEFINNREINIIVASPRLDASLTFRDDPV